MIKLVTILSELSNYYSEEQKGHYHLKYSFQWAQMPELMS